MPNPLKQLLNQNNLKAQFRQFCAIMQGKNPAQILRTMVMNNPNVQPLISLMNDAGNDPQKAFYALAKQKGVDPNEILDQLR